MTYHLADEGRQLNGSPRVYPQGRGRGTLTVALTILAASSLAQSQTAPATAPLTQPSENDLVRARVALTAGLRTCLPEDGWSLHVHAAFATNGRVTFTPSPAATWSAQETNCMRRTGGRVHGPRFTASAPFETDFTIEGRDPRPELLRTIDVTTCYPQYDADRCHLNAAIAVNARRPNVTNGVTWDVQGCIPNANQLACIELSVGRVQWPVNPRDATSFHGRVGPGT